MSDTVHSDFSAREPFLNVSREEWEEEFLVENQNYPKKSINRSTIAIHLIIAFVYFLAITKISWWWSNSVSSSASDTGPNVYCEQAPGPLANRIKVDDMKYPPKKLSSTDS